MQVYVLCQVIDYEGEYLLGVYASREDAMTAAVRYQATQQGGSIDGLALYTREVGAPAVFGDAAEYFDGTE